MLQIKSLLKTHKKQIAIFVFLSGVVCIYYLIDPSKSSLFLKCPLKSVSGYDCPGCGAQRALHELLHFRFLEAFTYNPLFVLSLAVAIVFVSIKFLGNKQMKAGATNFLKSKFFIFSLLMIVLVFLLLRNTGLYKDFIYKYKREAIR
ncbi:DUF2752 domain-containing protein [Chryseobacterium sp. FH1]|uniref:DUF2752 domain-containing protein n=1 Tax=Chryseobacterium sp. FH1 TaxID=1233951 RepID=UPI00068F3BF5|nr:DUF2752 domain-containing protein [Chryseobacterium sp. FH1]